MQEPIVPERLRKQAQKHNKQPRAGKQLRLTAFTLLMIGLIAYGAYYFFIPKQEDFRLDFYTYAEVGITDFLETLGTKGTIIPKQVTSIEPKIAGIVEEVFVQEGMDVQVGDPLIRLYSEEIVAEKNESETELGELETKLAQLSMDQELAIAGEHLKILDAQEQLEQAISNLELQKVLFGYGSIARIDLEKTEQEVEAAGRRVEQSQRELELLTRKHQAELASLEKTATINREKLAKALEKMENFIVTAPFSGRVLALKIPNNRIVNAHQNLGELADLSEQIVEMQVSPGQTERFGVGTETTIVLGQTEYKGEVAYIAPQAKQGNDGPTVLVRVEFSDDVSHLRPNSNVTANIHIQLHKNSLYLPRGAYLASGQQLFVYVIDGNIAKQRDVQFGILQGNEVQIIRGLELGERVIISSYDSFRHLEEIEILPEGGRAL